MRLLGVLLLAAVFASPRVAGAQPQPPMMPDPSAMSGIPRPDPSVPPGKLVVRVIRGDFAHPMVGTEVTLDGPVRGKSAHVGADGRANFDGLALGGPYVVSATSGEQTVGSQKIELPAEAGVKVMLVFKPDEKAALLEHDGEARADPSLPRGTLLISVVDEGQRPLAGMPVVVAHGTAPAGGGQATIAQDSLFTDAKGEARYQGKADASEGFLISVKKDQLSANSKPFRLDGAAGMRVGLRAIAVTQDAARLFINRKSHIILDVKDEVVEVIENLVIENPGGAEFDPGPAGLVFKLPADAQGAQPAGQPTPGLAVSGTQAVLRGRLAPGETPMAIGFVLPQRDGSIELVQTLPVRMDQLLAVTGHFAGMAVRGDGLSTREVEQSGRAFTLINGKAIDKDGELRVAIVGLPHRSPAARYLAVCAAGLIGLWGLWAAYGRRRGDGPTDDRARLAAEKRSLLDEISAIERGKAGTAKAEAKHARRHDELMEKLERVMRELDDHAE